jgi:hypothetical protein
MMKPLVNKRFRDRIARQFGDALVFHAPLDERAGQQNTRDLIGTKQGDICANTTRNAQRIFSSFEGGSLSFVGHACLVRNIGAPGDFAFITEESDWQIHFFALAQSNRVQVLIATESASVAAIGQGFAFSEQANGALRFDFARIGEATLSAQTAAGVSVVGKPSLYSLIRSAGALSLYVNGALVPWASNTIGTTQTTGEQLLPFAIGGEPAGPPVNFDGRMQHVFIVRGQRPEPQGDVDFVYREAIRGMSLWDWFSQAYPTTDVFCEFDEDAGGTTLVNRAGADGTYLGGVVVENSRISARTGLSAKFFRESVSRAVLASIRCDYVQKTGVFSIFMVLQAQDAFATATRIIVRNGAYGTYIPGFRVSFNGPSQIRFLLNDGVFGADGYTTNIGFNLGRDVSNETISIAVVGDGTGISLYLDGALRSRSTALSLVNVDGFSGVTAFTNNIAGASALSCQAGLMLITPVAMQAHEVMHLHKLTELSGYFDRPDEFLEYDITTGETPLPEPPPPGDEGYLLTEDGFILTTENGERIVIEDAP